MRRSATLVSTQRYCNTGKQFMRRQKLRIHNGGLARHVTGNKRGQDQVPDRTGEAIGSSAED
jgi:hypothetical protein